MLSPFGSGFPRERRFSTNEAVDWSRRPRRLPRVMGALPRWRWQPAWRRARSGGVCRNWRRTTHRGAFGGPGRDASRRLSRACPRESGGPDIGRRSRGAGRTVDAGGSAIAVAVDLQKRATTGRGAAAAGPPGEPHPGGRIAQRGGLQPARQPQDQGGRQPPGSGCAIRPYQHPSGRCFGRTAASDLGRHQEEGTGRRFPQQWPRVSAARVSGRGRVHDFLIKELGRAVPYGVYDLAANAGWVSVGVEHDTAAFAVNSIRQWWLNLGRARYPNATRLLITADGGGSNGSRVRLWKRELQKLANELGLDIVVSHLPPGTSKWNKIEHRLFSFISQNWRAQPLVSYRVIIELISATTTKTGLTVRCELDTGQYPKGVVVSDAEMAAINIKRAEFHGEWNYTISPDAHPPNRALIS